MDLTSHVPSTGLTVHFSGQWIYAQLQDGTTLNIPAPNAEVVYSPTATTATTTYTGGQWVTTVPTSFTGNVFLAGVAYQVPAGVSLQGAKVTWTGDFSGRTNSFKLQWRQRARRRQRLRHTEPLQHKRILQRPWASNRQV